MKTDTRDVQEGPAAFDRFRDAVRSVLSVKKSELPPKPTRAKKKATKKR